MDSLSEEKNKEINETKEGVKKINADGITKILTDIRDDSQKLKTEQVDIKRMLTDLSLGAVELRSHINIIKAMGFRGSMGTGSTAHKKD